VTVMSRGSTPPDEGLVAGTSGGSCSAARLPALSITLKEEVRLPVSAPTAPIEGRAPSAPSQGTKKSRLLRPSGPSKPARLSAMERRRSLTGWAFIVPAAALIVLVNFWPMIQALFLSLKTGHGTKLHWAEPLWSNYSRLLQDDQFRLTLSTTVLYLVIQVPIMLGIAIWEFSATE